MLNVVCGDRGLALPLRVFLFQQLDSIFEGVEERESVESGHRGLLFNPHMVFKQVRSNLPETFHLKGRMAFRFALPILYADVQLNVCDLEPETAILLQRFRLLYLFEAEDMRVKLSGPLFFARGNAKLHVIQSLNVNLHRDEV